jgi:hypothetical protein
MPINNDVFTSVRVPADVAKLPEPELRAHLDDLFDEAKQDMVRFISRERGEDWKHLVVNRLTPIPECECGCNDKKEQDND